MRLDRLTPAHLRRAIDVYIALAWPSDRPGRPRFDPERLEAAPTTEAVLKTFEASCTGNEAGCHTYSLRLGNWRYPFMKLALQEYLVRGEYFFSVDTHDDLKISPDMPDYEGWQEVRRFNRRLKLDIEQAWEGAELPTYVKLRELMEGLAELEREGYKRARLLLVDDEHSVVRGLATALRARGYEVEVAFDGEEVLERLEHEPLPDLLLLDYAMPGVDGDAVLHRVRGDPRCKHLPVLLATASNIDLRSLQRDCGLLRKPYPREVLFAMIAEILSRSSHEGA